MNKIREQKGITLVALIVTIIILLILAGITISSLTGSGLFGQSKEAQKQNAIAEGLEKLNLIAYELQIEKMRSSNIWGFYSSFTK